MGLLDYLLLAFFIVLVLSLVKGDYVYVASLLIAFWFLDREGWFPSAITLVLLWFLVLVLVYLVKRRVSAQQRTRRTAGPAMPQQAASVREHPDQSVRTPESAKPRICMTPACGRPVRAGAYMTPAELLKWWPGRTSAASLCRECYDRRYPPLRIT